jgi:hypothetical protein
MIVTSEDADKIVGSVNLDFPEAGHISMAFSATWVPRQGVCF